MAKVFTNINMGFYENKAILVGNIVQTPEMKKTQTDQSVTNLVVATNRSFKKGDKYEDIATFHRIVIWGKLAEFVAKNMKKGDRVYVNGRIDNRSYDTAEGERKYISEIVAFNIVPMSKKGDAQAETERHEQEFDQQFPNNNRNEEIVDVDDIPL